jgi:hypothetical protein
MRSRIGVRVRVEKGVEVLSSKDGVEKDGVEDGVKDGVEILS